MKYEKHLFKVAWLFIGAFLFVVAYLIKFTVVDTQQMIIHPANKRLDQLEDEVIRGRIYDATGNILAETIDEKRYYLHDELYAHAIGYTQMGKYGVEAMANAQLLYPDYTVESLLDYTFGEGKLLAHDVILTLEHTVQNALAEGFGERKGAAVVVEPSTGKILGMYSSQGFNPNTLEEDWEELIANESDSPLLNRATQGLYPPGSVFKIITTLAYLQQEGIQNWDEEVYECTGSVTIGTHTLNCYNQIAHGVISAEEAFERSCNTFFVQLSNRVVVQTLFETAEEVLFEQILPVQLTHSKSLLTAGESIETNLFNQLASYIGQGQILASPLHMAMLSGAIYNNGVLMQPYMIDYAKDTKANEVFKNLPIYEDVLVQSEYSSKLKELMIDVVEEGTANRIKQQGLILGGKTGTAQNETNKDHSWFMGFAESESGAKPAIAFAIIVEQGGEGAAALNVTEKLIGAYF